jgi:3-oxoacyl-[acyl-carrier-protein] synthase-1
MNHPENTPLYLSAFGLVNALGASRRKVVENLLVGSTDGLVETTGLIPGREAKVGMVTAGLPDDTLMEPDDTRNNRLLLAALAQIEDEVKEELRRWGPDRIGVVIGTSTSGIAEGEAAVAFLQESGSLPGNYHYTQQEIGRPALFMAAHLGLGGPAITISTACTSSASAFVTAAALIRNGFCDTVLVGGADSLCRLTVNGFFALDSVSDDLCNPMSVNRDGINIGEGAALFILRQEKSVLRLVGTGESSDAYHVSSPDPEGKGAERAMRMALASAGLSPDDITYVNLHATATPKNDLMESLAMSRVFPGGVHCSGTKPLTGHMLGAAGATELAFCCLILDRDLNSEGMLPPHRWDGMEDPELSPISLVNPGDSIDLNGSRYAIMSNSFAFGGSNVSLIVDKEG